MTYCCIVLNHVAVVTVNKISLDELRAGCLVIRLNQTCLNYAYGGFMEPGFLGHLELIFWDNIWYTGPVKETKTGSRIFLGPGKFLVVSKWDSKGKTLPLDCERVEIPTKLNWSRRRPHIT